MAATGGIDSFGAFKPSMYAGDWVKRASLDGDYYVLAVEDAEVVLTDFEEWSTGPDRNIEVSATLDHRLHTDEEWVGLLHDLPVHVILE